MTFQNKQEELENVIQAQRKELAAKEATLKQRTLDLDAMGYVWCDGGCDYGVYQKPGHEHLRPLTREMADRALRAAIRIMRKFGSTVEWKQMTESERVCMRAKELERYIDRDRADASERKCAELEKVISNLR